MHAVPVPPIAKGMDARVSLYDHRRALEKANTRLEQSRDWYDTVRTEYGRPE